MGVKCDMILDAGPGLQYCGAVLCGGVVDVADASNMIS